MKYRSWIQRISLIAVTLGVLSGSVLAQSTTSVKTLPLRDRSMVGVPQDASLGSLIGPNGLVLVFWSTDCPWVKKNEVRLVELGTRYTEQGFGFVVVNSSNIETYPEEGLDGLKQQATDGKYPFASLADEGGELARALGAERTPQVFVFNNAGERVYSGAIDDSPAIVDNVSSAYLHDALEAMIKGEPIGTPESKAIGCMIKF